MTASHPRPDDEEKEEGASPGPPDIPMATTLDPRHKPHHPTTHEQAPHTGLPRQRRATRSRTREPVVLADALGEVLDTLLERSHVLPEHRSEAPRAGEGFRRVSGPPTGKPLA